MSDIYSGSGGSYPEPGSSDQVGYDSRYAKDSTNIYFRASHPSYSYEMWRSDGTNNVTALLCDIYGGGNNSSPYYITAVNGRVYFRARNTSSNYEPWYTTPSGSYGQVADIYGGSTGSYPEYMRACGDLVFFSAEHPSYGREMWVINSNNNNCSLLSDIWSGSTSSSPSWITDADDAQNGCFFRARNENDNYELWFSDGTSSGTRMVKEIQPSTSQGSYPEYVVAVGGVAYFSAEDGSNGRELWRSDGTTNGTTMVKDIVVGGGSSNPRYLTVVGDKIFFTCFHPSYGWELWMSDGTEGGTRIVADIRKGPNDASPEWLRSSGGALYFNAHNDGTGRELYRATQSGVMEFLCDVYPGTNSGTPTNMEYLDGYVYFASNNGQNGQEVYRVPVPPSIAETDPLPNSVDNMLDTNIDVLWDQAINQNSVTSDSYLVRASFSGNRMGQRITLQGTVSFNPSDDFLPGEEIEVVLTNAIENTSMLSPTSGRVFRFRCGAIGGPAEFDPALMAGVGGSQTTAAVAAADFDGDGDLDIAVASRGGQNRVYLNDGNGGFSSNNSTTFGTGSDLTTCLAVGDIDNDGDPDLLAGNQGEANVAYFNDGSAGFANGAIAFSPGSDETRALALGDLNGDGFLDAVAVNSTQQNLIHINDGTGDFSLIVQAFGSGFDDSTGVAIGDVDADGALDIAVSNLFNPSKVYFNDGLGKFDDVSQEVQIGVGAYFSTGIALGDVNGDGALDVALANRSRRNLVLYALGRAFPTENVVFDTANNTDSVVMADFNGDHKLDIAYGNSSGQNNVWLNDGMGGFGATNTNREFGSGSDATIALAAADLDADGDMDLMLGNAGGPFAIAPNEMATPTAPMITSTAPDTVTAGDLYSYTITATGLPSPTLSVNSAPSWLSLNGNVLSGTPSDSDIGTSGIISITAANGVGADSIEQFTITVTPRPEAAMITSNADTVAAVGQTYTYSISTTGFPTPTLTVSGNPAWLTLTGSTLSGTPSASDVGTAGPITIRAINGVGTDAVEIFSIVVSLEQAPSITSTAPLMAEVGNQYTYTITTTGSPAPTITHMNLPAWLTLNGNVLSGIPSASDAGPDGVLTTPQITIRAANGVGIAVQQQFQITVLDTSRLIAPVIQSQATPLARVGNEYSYQILAFGSPAPTITVSGLPDWLSFDTGSGVISGTPAALDAGVTTLIEVMAMNGIGSDARQAFQIVVLSETPPATTSESTCALSDESNAPSAIMLLALLAAFAWIARSRRVSFD